MNSGALWLSITVRFSFKNLKNSFTGFQEGHSELLTLSFIECRMLVPSFLLVLGPHFGADKSYSTCPFMTRRTLPSNPRLEPEIAIIMSLWYFQVRGRSSLATRGSVPSRRVWNYTRLTDSVQTCSLRLRTRTIRDWCWGRRSWNEANGHWHWRRLMVWRS